MHWGRLVGGERSRNPITGESSANERRQYARERDAAMGILVRKGRDGEIDPASERLLKRKLDEIDKKYRR